MSYIKPELVKVAKASTAIQDGSGAKGPSHTDQPSSGFNTAAAYEADE